MRYVDTNEKWKYINNTNNMYKISNWGRVSSFKYGDERIIKGRLAGKGYLMVDLRTNGICEKKYVHRLVAIHFIKNSKNLPEVNHKDGNKKNNHKSNLNWTNGVGNMKHARKCLGFNMNGEKSPNSKLTKADVLKIIKLYKTGKYTSGEIGKMYNVCYKHVWALSKGLYWKHLKIA